jgi:hypothetical protein
VLLAEFTFLQEKASESRAEAAPTLSGHPRRRQFEAIKLREPPTARVNRYSCRQARSLPNIVRGQPLADSSSFALPTRNPLARSHNDIVSTPQDADEAPAALVAVTGDMAGDLERAGLATPLPTLRGAVIDAAFMIGADAATIVTLMHTPAAIRAFAGWLHDRFTRRGDSITIQGRRGGVSVTLQVDGSVPIETITGFIADVLNDRHIPGSSN